MHSPDRANQHQRVKSALRTLLAAGAGTLVVASTIVVTATAEAAPSPGSLAERVEQARARLTAQMPRSSADGTKLAWHAWHNWQDSQYHDQVWSNVPSWHNTGYADPRWQNWQNWHNWHDWNDWRNTP